MNLSKGSRAPLGLVLLLPAVSACAGGIFPADSDAARAAATEIARLDPYPVRYFHAQEPVSLAPPQDWTVTELPTGTGPSALLEPGDGRGVFMALYVRPAGGGQSPAEAQATFLRSEGLRPGEGTPESLASQHAGRGVLRRVDPVDEASPAALWVGSVVDGGQAAHLLLNTTPDGGSADFDRLRATLFSLRVEPSEPMRYDRRRSLVLASAEPPSLDPAKTHFGATGLIGDLYRGLVRLDADLQVRPDLALSWRTDASGTQFTFYLDPGAKFHNGRPITAEDVRFSWLRAAQPDTRSETAMIYLGDIVGLEAYHAGQAEDIAGVNVLDEHTLRVAIDEPKPYFLAKLTYPVSYVVDRENVGFPGWEDHPNGSGPFRHRQHLKDQIFLLEASPFYAPAPRLEQVVYLMYTGYAGRLYELDQVDVAGIPQEQLERAEDPDDDLHGQVVAEASMCTSYVSLNTQSPPFDDVHVRRALAMAVDRERYAQVITQGRALPARGILPPGMPGMDDAIAPPPFDPEAAQAELAESDYALRGGLPPVVWTLPSSAGRYSGAVDFLLDAWESGLGLEVVVEGIESQVYFDQIDRGNYANLLIEGWCADYPDPQNFLEVLFHSQSAQNHAAYDDPQVDAWLQSARASPDWSARRELYLRAEQHILDAAPVVVLTHAGPSYRVWKAHVRGYRPAPIGIPQHQYMWIER